jgi:sugar O-acyltransferase (sialic acid O-acetyltransferase NeuD family)
LLLKFKTSLNIYLYGCGGHAKVILDILHHQGKFVKAFIDDHPPATFSNIHGIPIIQSQTALSEITPDSSSWIVAIGNNRIRATIVEKLTKQGHSFTTAIHPSAQIGVGVKIGEGTVVMANAVINIDTTLGNHVIVNTGGTIDHDCIIGDYSHIAPGSNLCGQVKLGAGVLLGVGTHVCPCVEIGNHTTCGAGSVVIGYLPDNCLAYGCPAKIIKASLP